MIVISSLLLYKALVAQEENDSKNRAENLSNDVKIQKLEKRVRELESLLNRFVNKDYN